MTHAEVMERLTGVFRDVFDDDSIVRVMHRIGNAA